MTVLLTGPRGFVGAHLATKLQSLGHQVIPLGRNDPVPTGKVDAIVNCAGEINDPARMFDSNVTYVWRLLEWAREARVDKVVHIGSSNEYGPTNQPRREDMLGRPSTIYEGTKLAATALCQGYAAAHDMDIVVARPFSLYGPNDTPRKLIPRLYRSYIERESIEVHPGAHDWLYIDDFTDGLVALLVRDRAFTQGDIVNFGTGVSSSNYQVVDAMVAALGGINVTYRNGPYHPYDVTHWVADITKAATKYGWRAKRSLAAGVKEYVMAEWFKEDLG